MSPFLGSSCRYEPSCSEYALESFERFSFFKAFYLTAKRLLSCHPWGKVGVDPVPKEGCSCH